METLIIRLNDKKKLKALKLVLKAMQIDFKKKNKSPYDPYFVAKILQGDDDFKAGRTISITLDDI